MNPALTIAVLVGSFIVAAAAGAVMAHLWMRWTR